MEEVERRKGWKEGEMRVIMGKSGTDGVRE